MSSVIDSNFEESLKRIKVSSLRKSVLWKLACHLDSHCSDSNWENLAEKLGMNYLQIKSIEDRVCYKKHCSCTLMLFEEQFFRKKLTVADLVTLLSAIGNEACIHVLKDAFQNCELFTAVKKTANHSNALGPVTDIETLNTEDKKTSKKTVFLTYSKDSIRPVRAIAKWLMKNGCNVSLDILELELMFEDKMGWSDRKYAEADYILMLISPQYALDIAGKGNGETSLMARYICCRMQSEYQKNLCLNKRFIPVLLPGAVHDHIPIWLQHRTIVYPWPEHFKAILLRIFNLLDPPSPAKHTPTISISRLEAPLVH